MRTRHLASALYTNQFNRAWANFDGREYFPVGAASVPFPQESIIYLEGTEVTGGSVLFGTVRADTVWDLPANVGSTASTIFSETSELYVDGTEVTGGIVLDGFERTTTRWSLMPNLGVSSTIPFKTTSILILDGTEVTGGTILDSFARTDQSRWAVEPNIGSTAAIIFKETSELYLDGTEVTGGTMLDSFARIAPSRWSSPVSVGSTSSISFPEGTTFFTVDGIAVSGGGLIGEAETDSVWTLAQEQEGGLSENENQVEITYTDNDEYTYTLDGIAVTGGTAIGGDVSDSSSIWSTRELSDTESEISVSFTNNENYNINLTPIATSGGAVIGGSLGPSDSLWSQAEEHNGLGENESNVSISYTDNEDYPYLLDGIAVTGGSTIGGYITLSSSMWSLAGHFEGSLGETEGQVSVSFTDNENYNINLTPISVSGGSYIGGSLQPSNSIWSQGELTEQENSLSVSFTDNEDYTFIVDGIAVTGGSTIGGNPYISSSRWTLAETFDGGPGETEGHIEIEMSNDSFMLNTAPTITGIQPSYVMGYQQTLIINGEIVDPDPDDVNLTIEVERTENGKYLFASAVGRDEVYVYETDNLSADPIVLTSPSLQGSGNFGYDISTAKDKLVISANNDNTYTDEITSDNHSGAVWVYDINDFSAGPTILKPLDGESNDQFGFSCAVSESHILVGSRLDQSVSGVVNVGSAYLYDLDDLSAEPIKITPPSPTSNDQSAYFGYTVALSSDKAFIGCYSADVNNRSDNGAVFVYDLNDLTSDPIVLSSTFPENNQNFGVSIATSDDLVVIGSMRENVGNTDDGAIYVFDAHNLSKTPTRLSMSNAGVSPQVAAYFGDSVSVDKNNIVVGAYLYDQGSAQDAGFAFVFNARDLSEPGYTIRPNGMNSSDQFGSSVALTGKYVAVSARYVDQPNHNTGKVYLFERDGTSVQTNNPINIGVDHQNAYFGHRIAFSDADPSYATIEQIGNTFVITGNSPVDTNREISLRFSVTDSRGATSVVNSLLTYENIAPAISGAESSYELVEGQDTVITMQSVDPDSNIITWGYREIRDAKLIVGAPYDGGQPNGTVYAYNEEGANEVKINSVSGGYYSGDPTKYVAITKEKIIVGAPKNRSYHDASLAGGGKVHVTNHDGSGGIEIYPSSTSPWLSGEFGRSVASNGSKIIVGSPWAQGMNGQGAAYIFDMDGSNEIRVNGQNGLYDKFGESVAMNESLVAVGVPYDESSGAGSNNYGQDQGSVYIFDLEGNTVRQDLRPPTSERNDKAYFGYAVELTDTHLFVSAKQRHGSYDKMGAVFVFDINDNFNLVDTIRPNQHTTTSQIQFGNALHVNDSKLVVSSERDEFWIYDLDGGNVSNEIWVQRPDSQSASDEFGRSLIVTSQSVIVGAREKFFIYDFEGNLKSEVMSSDNNWPSEAQHFAYAMGVYDPSRIEDTTVSQSENVFTVTPGATPTNFTLEIFAEDEHGNRTATTSNFTLAGPEFT